MAEQLCAQGKRAEAQPYVLRIKNSQYLTKKERAQVAKMLDQERPAKSGSLLSKLPFIGKAHVAYFSDKEVINLLPGTFISKARLMCKFILSKISNFINPKDWYNL